MRRVSRSFSVVAHEVRLLVSTIFKPNPHGRFVPVCAEVPQHPCGKSVSFRAEQPRNSSDKVKFSVSCTAYEGAGLFHVPQVACIPDDNDLFNHGDTVSYQTRVSVVVGYTVF